MKPIPILLFSDNPALTTGLGRITRQIAFILSTMPEFRVGTFGRGGLTSRRLPWMQYYYPESTEWGQEYFWMMWRDFAGDEPGIVLTINDAPRMHWFTRPKYITNAKKLKELLESGQIKKWGYFPIDHQTVNGGMSVIATDAVLGYDRVLGYGAFGAEILSRVVPDKMETIRFIPHGLNMETFHPLGGDGYKFALNIEPGTKMIGMVATNQVRKDWGMAAAVTRALKDKGHKVKLWACVDDLNRHWDIRDLCRQYAIEDNVMLMSGSAVTDTVLAFHYSMCDATILPTRGEGFGYPIVESMACGTPCITTNYAGGAELVPRREWLIDPVAWEHEAPLNAMRPVTDVNQWVDALELTFGMDPAEVKLECTNAVQHLNIELLSTVWRKWLLAGIMDIKWEINNANKNDTEV